MLKVLWGVVFIVTGVFFAVQVSVAAVVLWPVTLLVGWWWVSRGKE